MFLKHLSLQNFRSYKKSQFSFNPGITYLIGHNTAGKTNLIEAISLLSTGKSFRAAKDREMITHESEIARVKGTLFKDNSEILLEAIITPGMVAGIKSQFKKYMVNGIPKRRVDFASNLPVVLFKPDDLDIIIGSPGLRRDFLDSVLEQVSSEYRHAIISYTKALRQRNALLDRMRDMGIFQDKQLEYWNDILITYGQTITRYRQEVISYFNSGQKEIFECRLEYDNSIISEERLLQYQREEIAAASTLVGPHRDDFIIKMGEHDIRQFGSRGQQRLAIIQLKLLQISYIEETLQERPILLLDDFFSELDAKNIDIVLSIIDKQQTILTTTHKEFLPKIQSADMDMIELKQT